MLSFSGEKTPLKMTVCTNTDGVVSASTDPGQSVSLLINPSSVRRDRHTLYDNPLPMGDTGTGRKFNRMPPDTLSFSAVLDGTGVVPRPTTSTTPSEVADQVSAIDQVIHKYNGQKHEPNIVEVSWGSIAFVGRVTTFSIDYTLFRPSGAPLRATISLNFESYMSGAEEQLSADASSPDLSHSVVVRAGDSLPLLCFRIYGDSRYYPEVARFNGLRQFRDLPPGLRLHFPPLD